LAAELDLPEFTSHGFRHCVGYHLLRAGCQVRYIQEILGHEHIQSTEVYTKIDKENLKAVLDQYHPRRWKKAP
jgi:site-specific recombinase XerD